MHTQYHHMPVSIPATQMTKRMVKITMALLQCTIDFPSWKPHWQLDNEFEGAH